MANPAAVNVRGNGQFGSDLAALVTQVNNLTASVRLLTLKLDADAGVTDTDYTSTTTATGIATAPATITTSV